MTMQGDLAEIFGLGVAKGPPVQVAAGWGGHNTVSRFVTSTGVWALKRHGWRLPPNGASAFAIAFAVELDACAGGVPMARPVPTTDGQCWAEIDGHLYRCHEWVDGQAKQNETTSVLDAAAMGGIVAHLHGLRIPCPPPASGAAGRGLGRQRWENMAAAGHARGAPWASRLSSTIQAFAALDTQPGPTDGRGDEIIGSHGDLNAHNVLFTDGGLHLIDWDGAGRAWARWERATYPLLWAQRDGGRYDPDAVVAFLRGYVEGGGTVEADDPAALGCAPAALAPWVAQNIEMAVDRPTSQQDLLAGLLVDALVAMPRTVAIRQVLLAECLDAL